MDPAAGHLFAVSVFRQIGLAAEELRSPLDPLVERHMLESLQRIEKDESRDRPLGRQQFG